MGKIFSQEDSLKQEKVSLQQFYGLKQSKNALYQSKISTRSSDKCLTRKQIPYTDQNQQINSYLAKLQYLGQYIQGENLHLPVYCQIKQNNQFCSDHHNLQLYYEIYDVKIKDQINARKREHEHFTQQEIWYILYSIVCGLKKFERFNLKSGNINTNNILLNDKGHLKIVNQLTYPEIEQFKQKSSKFSVLQNFYSPQQLRQMREKPNRSNKIHPNVSQTYSLGIIMLEIASFISGQQFYDVNNLKINQNLISKGFSKLQSLGYSTLLQNLMRVLLSNERDRPLPSQIYTAFKPYQKKILNLQRFEFQANRLYDSLYPSQVQFY